MKTTREYKASCAETIAFKHEHADENATTAVRIYHVNPETIQTRLQREHLRRNTKVKHGGHNKMLLDAQVDAIYKYVEDLYLSRHSVIKAMVYAAIGCLKTN